jgi:hypothetical protein
VANGETKKQEPQVIYVNSGGGGQSLQSLTTGVTAVAVLAAVGALGYGAYYLYNLIMGDKGIITFSGITATPPFVNVGGTVTLSVEATNTTDKAKDVSLVFGIYKGRNWLLAPLVMGEKIEDKTTPVVSIPAGASHVFTVTHIGTYSNDDFINSGIAQREVLVYAVVAGKRTKNEIDEENCFGVITAADAVGYSWLQATAVPVFGLNGTSVEFTVPVSTICDDPQNVTLIWQLHYDAFLGVGNPVTSKKTVTGTIPANGRYDFKLPWTVSGDEGAHLSLRLELWVGSPLIRAPNMTGGNETFYEKIFEIVAPRTEFLVNQAGAKFPAHTLDPVTTKVTITSLCTEDQNITITFRPAELNGQSIGDEQSVGPFTISPDEVVAHDFTWVMPDTGAGEKDGWVKIFIDGIQFGSPIKIAGIATWLPPDIVSRTLSVTVNGHGYFQTAVSATAFNAGNWTAPATIRSVPWVVGNEVIVIVDLDTFPDFEYFEGLDAGGGTGIHYGYYKNFNGTLYAYIMLPMPDRDVNVVVHFAGASPPVTVSVINTSYPTGAVSWRVEHFNYTNEVNGVFGNYQSVMDPASIVCDPYGHFGFHFRDENNMTIITTYTGDMTVVSRTYWYDYGDGSFG